MVATAGRFYADATKWAERYFPVFPLNGKIPAISEAKGGHGCTDGTLDHDKICQWAHEYPDANVGILFAESSQYVGMDVDTYEPECAAWLERAQREHGIIETMTVLSGNHGYHYYWQRPANIKIPNVNKLAHKGYEIKSDNQYLVAPGSIHPDTHRVYELAMDIDPQPMPEWLIADILAGTTTERSGNGHKPADNGKIPLHEHDAWLTSMAGTYRNRGDSEETIAEKLMLDFSRLDNQDPTRPYTREDALRIAHSIAKKPAGAPKKPESAPKPEPKIWGVDELLDADMPEQTWLIEGLIPDESLIALAGRKKLGKTWMATQIATAVATGGMFLGHKCTKGTVLLLALEDGERRLRRRLGAQKTPHHIPLKLIFEMEHLDKEKDGGLTQIKAWIEECKPRLIIIDTLAKALSHKLDQNSAGETAELVNTLHGMTVQYHVVIILISHHGKMVHNDVGMDIRGSSAIPGATDGNFGLYRQGDDYFFKGESRDIEEFDLKVFLNKEETFCWELLGDTKRLAQQLAEKAIIDALAVLGEADANAIASESSLNASTVRARCKKMREDGLISFRTVKKRILYKAK